MAQPNKDRVKALKNMHSNEPRETSYMDNPANGENLTDISDDGTEKTCEEIISENQRLHERMDRFYEVIMTLNLLIINCIDRARQQGDGENSLNTALAARDILGDDFRGDREMYQGFIDELRLDND